MIIQFYEKNILNDKYILKILCKRKTQVNKIIESNNFDTPNFYFF